MSVLQFLVYVLFYLVFVVLGFERRASHLLGSSFWCLGSFQHSLTDRIIGLISLSVLPVFESLEPNFPLSEGHHTTVWD
jgi:hypothetical protein